MSARARLTGLEALLTSFRSAKMIDLSPLIETAMDHWPTHPPVVVDHEARTHATHGYYCQVLDIPEHTGSHVDAPAHVVPELMDRTIDTVPLERLCGPGKKVDVRHLDLGPGDLLDLDTFQAQCAQQQVAVVAGDIVLLQWGWDRYLPGGDLHDPAEPGWWSGNQPGFAEDLCAWFAQVGVHAVGADTSACDSSVIDGEILTDFGHKTHFLPNDIYILEGLVGLERIPSEFLFIGLPLRIHRGSGSPIRAVALVAGDDPSAAGGVR